MATEGDDGDRLRPLAVWLAREGRLIGTLGAFLDAFLGRANQAGLPIWRFSLGLQLMHPQLQAMGVLWRRGEPVQDVARRHGIQFTSAYIGSPVQAVREFGRSLRRRLDDLTGDDHVVLHEVRAGGGTDYLAIGLPIGGGGHIPVVTIATDRPDGFSGHDLDDLRRLPDLIGAIVEMHINRMIATTVVETYLGPETGRRILRGAIRRGDGERINAVLWFSDLRDFTGLNERLPADKLLELLNTYFEVVGAALKRHGGEILKFIGDGVMAIFPIEDAMFLPEATGGAIDATREALAAIDEINAGRVEAGREAIRFGIGLHVGIVTFGNVGTEDRLDFTVIGPAVNRCARLESMTKALGVPALASADFRRVCARPMRSLGLHRLRGMPEPMELFTPGH